MMKMINKKYLINKFLFLLKKNQRTPLYSDFLEFGISKDTIKHHFSSLEKLELLMREQYPNKFPDVRIKSLLDNNDFSSVDNIIKSHKRFVITTAVSGCSVDLNFLKSIKSYCNKNKAKLLVLIATDPAAIVDKKIDKILKDEILILKDTKLNSNIFLSTIKLSAKHIDPITSLNRIGQRNGSFIYASPKQRLKLVPVSNIGSPHALMTTGAITLPNYKTDKYMSERTAYIAENDHIMGAVIVEVCNDKIYHFRQIQADKNGAFIDLGKEYLHNGKVIKNTPEAFVLGDWHSGETDPLAAETWYEIARKLQPNSIILHDAFNGAAINHHERRNNITLAKRFNKNQLNLSNELDRLSDDILKFLNYTNKVVIVKSNHDEFLNRYLQEGMYAKDPQNHYISLILSKAMLDGHDPLKFAIEDLFNKKNQSHIIKNVLWLKRDDDYKVAKIQLAAHGDKGANGSRGSLKDVENAYGMSVTGHSHTPEILRGAWCVGTSSLLRLGYNVGPSSWLHSSCLVYKNGSRQLINSIDGQWCLNNNRG